ncbi:hypothetical protein [Paludisphaera mucosa]|uniref:Uncharacterized protein n=1 Tax=Paludisphaera mucosa TaxID=3030827 RepID=A0ABT6FCK2_9BACT|nr:hypothetical protein [Paludisphaera mucosa]MDG3005319.1 hypothetical protein [Paludisphaera mucosa]
MNETSTQRRAEPWSRVDRTADGPHAPATPPTETGLVRPTSGRFWGLVGLAILTGVTSLVVATISIWLTPVYMAAMVLIFATPRPNRPAGSPATSPTAPASPPDDAATASPEAGAVAGADDGRPEGLAAATAPAEDPAEPPSTKPRKRRGKGKRAAKAAALAEAAAAQPTWIRVGPGKFVRADVQAPTETENETETPAEAETDSQADPEASPTSAPGAFAAAGEAVDPETDAEATPASPYEERPREPSPAPFDGDEAAPPEFDEEYGIAPSALAGSREPEALPDPVSDDEPTPAPEPSSVAGGFAQGEARDEVPAETGVPAEVRSMGAAMPQGAGSPTQTIASPTPGRPAPERSAARSSESAVRSPGLGVLRRVSRIVGRGERVRTSRPRGSSPRPARSGRTTRVRGERRPGRRTRRWDDGRRRRHPRSPPRGA